MLHKRARNDSGKRENFPEFLALTLYDPGC